MLKRINQFEINKKSSIIWILILSFTFSYFFTSNSPFYKFNNWGDSNVYTWVGRSWLLHGKIPYKDIFDHKGPIIFLIMGIGTLIKYKTLFLGIYILESLNFAITLYFLKKISNLYLKDNKTLIVITIMAFFLFKNAGNGLLIEYGGSPEEFSLSPLVGILYFITKKLRNNIALSKKENLIIGFFTSIVFLLKFTLILPIILVLLIIFLSNIKKEFIPSLWIASGFIPLTLITCLYFYTKGGFHSFIHYYFYINIFSYDKGSQLTIVGKVIQTVSIFIILVKDNIILKTGLVLIPTVLIIDKKLTKEKFFTSVVLIILVSSSAVVSLLPGRIYPHYLLTTIPFAVFPIMFIVDKINITKSYWIICIILLILELGYAISVTTRSINESRFVQKQDVTIQKFAKIINNVKEFDKKKDDIKLMGPAIRTSIFTLVDTPPKSHFFYEPGMYLKEFYDELHSDIKKRKLKYIITTQSSVNMHKELLSKYKIVSSGPVLNDPWKLKLLRLNGK